MLLEIAAFNFHSAVLAAQAGADRIEICENTLEGGVTPSLGVVKVLKQLTSVPIFPMVRPRGGDFLYTMHEVEVMKHDIALFKELGCEGVVLGVLTRDGSVDKAVLKELVELASPMEVTFHRAFDRAKDPMAALEDIIEAGCNRILTSGQMPTAKEGMKRLHDLVAAARGRLVIMPGCGVTSQSIREIAEYTGATELHSAAKATERSAMDYKKPELNEDLNTVSVDVEEVRRMKAELRLAGNKAVV
ncbi:MAG: copper homeostasis protein CutC [Sphingobacteriales bacterium]|nr:MAG: copper homeostasis protein CutC [Sphingobacteriales bacterium]